LDCSPDWPLGFNDGETKQVGPWQFTALPQRTTNCKPTDAGRHHFLGYVVKFGSFAVYHSGDTQLV
jgi:L-ascorbate metabolism protein UlaG (beta-lactamase superfamily)